MSLVSKDRLTKFAVRSLALFSAGISLAFSNSIAFGAEAAAAPVSVQVTRIGDATHLEFSGLSEWKYDLKQEHGKADRVLLRVAGLKPEAIAKLRGLNDTLVKNVQINENGLDGASEVSFGIGAGTDFFDYISDQPARLVVDFFPKEAPLKEAAPAAAAAAKALPAKAAKPAKKVVRAENFSADDAELADEEAGDRQPANDGLLVAKAELPEAPSLAEQISSKKDFSHGIFDGGDPEFRRFTIKDYEINEDAIIASRANFYLPFPMLDLGTPQLKTLISAAPSYEIVPEDSRENKEARILLGLFGGNKRALFLKTAEEFTHEYPDSRYDEIVRYMIADAHYDIYRASNSVPDFETAMSHYLALSEKYPESPMAPRTLLLMGNSYLDRGDSFGALKAFQRFTRLHADSKHIDRVNISIADAYLMLNRFDDAFALLDQIEKTGKTEKGRDEAAFRKGDVFFRRKNYAGAIENYKGAIKRHPAAASRFANAYYNIAESEFQNQKYKESLEAYREFLQKFPDHAHGGFAMTRMGELLGILGAKPTRAQGAFMESYFRYRATPGAGVARIRLQASRMPDMKEKELASALREIDKITKLYANRPLTKKEIAEEKELKEKQAAAEHAGAGAEGGHGGGAAAPAHAAHAEKAEDELALVPKDGEDPTRKKPELPGIEEFTSLLVSDGYSARKDYDTAVERLINYYVKNPQSPNKDKIKIRIERNMSDGIRTAVDRGDFMDALRRYSKNAGGWLKNTDRIDVRYSVGRAYEQAGVFKEAMSVYADAIKRLDAVKGKKEAREHAVFETLPKQETIELRMASVAAKDKNYLLAEAQLKKIAQAKSLTEPEQIERAEIAADVAEARGQSDVARKYLADLVQAWKGNPELTSPLHLRMARLETNAKNFKAADQHLGRILDWKKAEKASVSDDIHAKALEMRADLLVTRGKRKEAVGVYEELLAAYEESRPLGSVRYRLGQLLYQDGDLKGAETVWNELQTKSKGEKETMWQKLAQEQMQGAKWQSEYKKYLNRIPAAASIRP